MQYAPRIIDRYREEEKRLAEWRMKTRTKMKLGPRQRAACDAMKSHS